MYVVDYLDGFVYGGGLEVYVFYVLEEVVDGDGLVFEGVEVEFFYFLGV